MEEMTTFISWHHGQQFFTTSGDPQRLQPRTGTCWGWPPTTTQADGLCDSWYSEVLLLKKSSCTSSNTYGRGHLQHWRLLRLPVMGDFKELQGERLHEMQQSLVEMGYLIIDKMSMVGRKFLSQVDKRLRQVFPHRADTLLEVAHVYSLETLGSFLLWWISHSTPPCHILSCLIKAMLHANSLNVSLSSSKWCVSLDKILTSFVASCSV